MNTYCKTALAGLVLAAATGAMASHTNSDSDHPDLNANATQAILDDLLASRQAVPTQTPRDGEWYNVPAPLGNMAQKASPENTGSAQAKPQAQAELEMGRK